MYRAIRINGEWGKEFISWDLCPLHEQAIQDTIKRLREAIPKKFAEESLWGVWIGTPHLVIVAKSLDDEALRECDWKSIIAPPISQVWFHATPQVGRQIFGRGEIRQIFGTAADSERASPIRAFRQTAKSLLKDARDLAANSLMAGHPEMVLDLYCGTGEISLLLPESVGWVGIEMAQEAVRFAETLRSGASAVHSAFVGAVEHRLRDSKVMDAIRESYALFLNPPRSGLSSEAREAIVTLIRKKRPTSIVYLSCSASSLARDIRVFELEKYRVTLLQPYDFFPQTEHFETLAVLAPDLRS